jgi:two-component system response regulator HydG
MLKKSVLVVDDSLDMLEVLKRSVNHLGLHVYTASNVQDAISVLQTKDVDLLITDLQMPIINGIELIKYSRAELPKVPVLVITGYPSISGAVEVMKAGAIEYLTKPFTTDELEAAVQKTIHLERSIKLGKKDVTWLKKYGLVGSSLEFQKINDVISRIRNHKVTVLIEGESGTGKELIARAIHYSGNYAQAPFVAVNCGAIPEELLESELFGFVKGAFTNAHQSREGFFEAANGGTIFLDEIGNASHKVQTRLLRVLQEKEVVRIGTTKPIKIDLRVIAATNSNLKDLILGKKFREDLYYRLNVISLELPPLRKRKEDIVSLTNHFLEKYSKEYKIYNFRLNSEELERLKSYDWPGNIRELENAVQRIMLMPERFNYFNDYSNTDNAVESLDEELTQLNLKGVEERHITKVLKLVDGNKTRAAQILGIDRKTLREKLKKIGEH